MDEQQLKQMLNEAFSASDIKKFKEELRKSKQNNRETMVEILEAQLPAGFHNILNRLLNPEDYQWKSRHYLDS